jgi:predicted DNA-binding ribbon-helix-helix protein
MTKPIVVGTPTFRDIIEGGFLYVDKTEAIYPLIRYLKGIYFLARPRRFGKSLTVSTLKEIFIGNKELFRDLWLYQSDYDWQPYPVLRFDFSKERVDSGERMIDTIKSYLEDIAYEYNISLQEGPQERQFRWLIKQLAEAHQGKVVILIDEYDKPLIDNLDAIAAATEVRDILRAFYGVIKAMDEYVRFVFITGISKFSRVGIFSQMNHLDDLTMNPEFAELVGITSEELHREFADYIDELAKRENLAIDALTPKIQKWYNGFVLPLGGNVCITRFPCSTFSSKNVSPTTGSRPAPLPF